MKKEKMYTIRRQALWGMGRHRQYNTIFHGRKPNTFTWDHNREGKEPYVTNKNEAEHIINIFNNIQEDQTYLGKHYIYELLEVKSKGAKDE